MAKAFVFSVILTLFLPLPPISKPDDAFVSSNFASFHLSESFVHLQSPPNAGTPSPVLPLDAPSPSTSTPSTSTPPSPLTTPLPLLHLQTPHCPAPLSTLFPICLLHLKVLPPSPILLITTSTFSYCRFNPPSPSFLTPLITLHFPHFSLTLNLPLHLSLTLRNPIPLLYF